MTCQEFRDALDGALDARSGLSSATRQHAETCLEHGCRVALEDFRLVSEAVRSVPPVDSPELVDRVMAALAPVVVSPRPFTSQVAPKRAGARSTILSLVTVAGVLVAAILGLRPRSEPTQVVKQPAAGTSKPPVAVAVTSPAAPTSGPETEPFIPLHLAARAPALVTDTVNGHFGRTAITGLPVVTPLMSAVTEQFRPMGQELKEWVLQFQSTPDETMDSTQVPSRMMPVG